MEWIVRQEGVDFAIHYLDDYLVIGDTASLECAEALTFLGFELDSSALKIRLPQAKLRELQQLISTWIGRRSCSRRELELLVGQLGHASRVVALGKHSCSGYSSH